MADPEVIIQKISLEGQAEVIAALTELGRAGAEALKQLEEGGASLSKVFLEITAGIAGVTLAMSAWAKVSSDNVVEMENLAKQAGITVEQMTTLRGAFATFGVSGEQLSSSFRRMSSIIEREWESIKKSTRDAVDTATNDQLKLQSSILGVTSAQVAARNAAEALQRARGIEPFVDTDPELQAQRKLQDASSAYLEAQQKLKEAQQARAEAAKKAWEDERNSIRAVSEAVNGLVTGTMSWSEAGQRAELSIQNIIKGLIAGTPGAKEALEGFKGGLTDIATAAPTVYPVLTRVMDLFHNLDDNVTKAALSQQLFGRQYSQAVINAFSQGSAAFEAEMARLKALGFSYAGVAEAATNFEHATNSLYDRLRTISSQIALSFAPAFTKGIEEFTKWVEDNRAKIVEWGSQISSVAIAALKGLGSALVGLGEIIRGLGVLLQPLADAFNTVFGGHTTGNILAVSVAIGALTVAIFRLTGPLIALASIGAVIVLGDILDHITKLITVTDLWSESLKAMVAHWKVTKDLVSGGFGLFGISIEEANRQHKEIEDSYNKTWDALVKKSEELKKKQTDDSKETADNQIGNLERVRSAHKEGGVSPEVLASEKASGIVAFGGGEDYGPTGNRPGSTPGGALYEGTLGRGTERVVSAADKQMAAADKQAAAADAQLKAADRHALTVDIAGQKTAVGTGGINVADALKERDKSIAEASFHGENLEGVPLSKRSPEAAESGESSIAPLLGLIAGGGAVSLAALIRRWRAAAALKGRPAEEGGRFLAETTSTPEASATPEAPTAPAEPTPTAEPAATPSEGIPFQMENGRWAVRGVDAKGKATFKFVKAPEPSISGRAAAFEAGTYPPTGETTAPPPFEGAARPQAAPGEGVSRTSGLQTPETAFGGLDALRGGPGLGGALQAGLSWLLPMTMLANQKDMLTQSPTGQSWGTGQGPSQFAGAGGPYDVMQAIKSFFTSLLPSAASPATLASGAPIPQPTAQQSEETQTVSGRLSEFGQTLLTAADAVTKFVGSLAPQQQPAGHAAGGVIPGYGGGDKVSAMLEPGEGVIRKDGSNLGEMVMHFASQGMSMGGVVKRFAEGGLVGLQTQMVRGYAGGGTVSAVHPSVAMQGSDSTHTIDFQINGQPAATVKVAGVIRDIAQHSARQQYGRTGPSPPWKG
jgi:hypothetical protein